MVVERYARGTVQVNRNSLTLDKEGKEGRENKPRYG